MSKAENEQSKPKVVVIYSGGMDSYTVLRQASMQGYAVYPVAFDYGQRHNKELILAKNVCDKYAYPFKSVDVSNINQLIKGSALTDDIDLGLDYSETWTCYKGLEKACGRCGSCQERLEAFAANGIKDPIDYF